MSFEDKEAIIRQIEDQLQAGITQAGHEDLSVMRLRDQYVDGNNESRVAALTHALTLSFPVNTMFMCIDWVCSYENVS